MGGVGRRNGSRSNRRLREGRPLRNSGNTIRLRYWPLTTILTRGIELLLNLTLHMLRGTKTPEKPLEPIFPNTEYPSTLPDNLIIEIILTNRLF